MSLGVQDRGTTTGHAGRKILRVLCALLGPALASAHAQDGPSGATLVPRAEFWGELPDAATAPSPQAVSTDGGANLFVAGHRTGARRYSDTFLTNGKKRRRPVAASIRLRRSDDANFTNRTRYLARRVEEMSQPVSPPRLGVATTGEEFLAALVEASRRTPIANLV